MPNDEPFHSPASLNDLYCWYSLCIHELLLGQPSLQQAYVYEYSWNLNTWQNSLIVHTLGICIYYVCIWVCIWVYEYAWNLNTLQNSLIVHTLGICIYYVCIWVCIWVYEYAWNLNTLQNSLIVHTRGRGILIHDWPLWQVSEHKKGAKGGCLNPLTPPPPPHTCTRLASTISSCTCTSWVWHDVYVWQNVHLTKLWSSSMIVPSI